ncbi:MAG: pyridoxamine 5'-phosphate oxidase family protein [Nitratireductor sp.]|nr:pyridoxamine 5'-phosphate oxidase family protein [Nitratireductor sp.]MCB1454760.1 pyridoxamine 5'-phosphate oxidase family protein [Nitratireductor sp.]
MDFVTSLDELQAVYGQPGEASLAKETVGLTPHYRAFVEASPFCALATTGPEGMDCSPRGDVAGFVRVHDERTLLMPDRRGNNRTDSLSNIVRNPNVALMFMVPGSTSCLRVNGTAKVTLDGGLCASFEMDGKAPRSVIVIRTEAVYFQCGRAIMRSHLWEPDKWADSSALPTPGQVLAALSKGRIGGDDYDREWGARASSTLW